MLDHVDHAVKVVGADHVTLGTDRAYVSCRSREENAKVRGRRGGPPPLGRRCGRPTIPWGAPSGAGSPWCRAWRGRTSPSSRSASCSGGYSDDDIRKILGGNILRVAHEVLD